MFSRISLAGALLLTASCSKTEYKDALPGEFIAYTKPGGFNLIVAGEPAWICANMKLNRAPFPITREQYNSLLPLFANEHSHDYQADSERAMAKRSSTSNIATATFHPSPQSLPELISDVLFIDPTDAANKPTTNSLINRLDEFGFNYCQER